MSAFTDIMTSLGVETPAAPSLQAPTRPNKPIEAQMSPTTALGSVNSGVKRKAGDAIDSRPSRKLAKTSSMSTHPMKKQNGVIAANKSLAVAISPIPTHPAPPKAPAKGSYTALLARAKEKQQERGGSQVGLIKHQIGTKERPSKPLSHEQARQDTTVRNKLASKSTLDKRTKNGKHGVGSTKRTHTDDLNSQNRPKSKDVQESSKAPPTQSPKRPVYKGTMGRSRDGQSRSTNPAGASSNGEHNTSVPHKRRKLARNDEYLGTDEEEDSDDGGSDIEGFEDDDHYGSDASSDMEAGAFEVAEEETRAERQARLEDKKELNEEQRLKKEKDERRRRLEILAKKNSGRR